MHIDVNSVGGMLMQLSKKEVFTQISGRCTQNTQMKRNGSQAIAIRSISGWGIANTRR